MKNKTLASNRSFSYWQQKAKQCTTFEQFRREITPYLFLTHAKTKDENYLLMQKFSSTSSAHRSFRERNARYLIQYALDPNADIIDITGYQASDTRRFLQTVRKRSFFQYLRLRWTVKDWEYIDLRAVYDFDLHTAARKARIDSIFFNYDDFYPFAFMVFKSELLARIGNLDRFYYSLHPEQAAPGLTKNQNTAGSQPEPS